MSVSPAREGAWHGEVRPAPSLHGYAAGSVADAVMLGVPGHGPEDERLRDERAVALLDARDELADHEDLVAGLELHPADVPSVGVARLAHRHGGRVAGVVGDPDFPAAARAHRGLA